MCEQRRTGLDGAHLEEKLGAFSWLGFVGEDADGAVGMEAVEDAGAGTDPDAQAFVADGHPAIGADLERGAQAPDIGPPAAAGHGPQAGALFPLGGAEGGVGGAAQFAVAFVGVAVAAQVGAERVGRLGRGDGFGGEEGRPAALPVWMLAFDLALGLGRAGVAQGDAVEVERGPELGEGVGALGKEQAVAVHIEFEGQAVFGEGGGEEVEVSQEVFALINLGPGADARAVIEQIEERIIFRVAGEPAVGRGVELPERAGLEALPAAQRGGRAWGREGMSQVVGEGPAPHGGGVELAAQTAMHFGGGAAVGRRWFGAEQLAQQRLGAGRPVWGVVPAGGSGRPAVLVVAGGGAEVVGVEFVEAGAAQAELIGGEDGGEFVATEGSEDFADQGSAEAVRELAVMFFIVARLGQWGGLGEGGVPARRAFRRPALRSGLLQARRAGSVRL